MSRIIFLNLSIDQNWARGSLYNSLFSNGNPSSLQLSLLPQVYGLYHQDFNPIEDTLVIPARLNPFWLEHFEKLRSFRAARFLIISNNPYNVKEWVSSFNDQFKLIGSKKPEGSLVVAGVSDLEMALNLEINQPMVEKLENSEFDFKSVNSKFWLLNWTRQQGIPFPKSKKVTGLEILEQMDSTEGEQYIFKSDISSGGGGQLNLERLKSILPWIQRQSLMDQWRMSDWLMQRKCNRIFDFSCFGSTQNTVPVISKITYDENGLSYRHAFQHKLSDDQHKLVQQVYQGISTELARQGYVGPFGFDGFNAAEDFFPIIDLNVRLTKTHLIHRALEFWNADQLGTEVFRIRFLNRKNVSFEAFWNEFCKKVGINDQGLSAQLKVYPLDVLGWMPGKAELTVAIGSDNDSVREKVFILLRGLLMGLAD